jgi:lipoate-protein ligase A
MILWCDGGHAARENMRRDASLLERLDAACDGGAEAEAVLRLFRFTPPGITLGYAQDPERTLDLDRCRADGVEWAVRPTGGRAIYHDDEWTYSFAARIADPEWGGGLHEAYGRVSRLVLASLAALGVPARLVARHGSGVVPERPGAPPRRGAAACFASTARHEVELDGKKLVGSAQRRTAHALLQQGSVLLGPSHVRLTDYLRLLRVAREAARYRLESNARPGGSYLGSDRGLERWADAVAGVFGPGVRRYSAEAGAFLLTPREAGSYTGASR